MNVTGKIRSRLSFNAPVVLIFAMICVGVQIINTLTGDLANRFVFSVGGRSLANPLTYLNCVCHIFGHSGWEHLLNNLMYILLVGPMLEEKYGSRNLILVMLVTAVVTGLATTIFFPYVVLCGASGVAFALILLTSITGTEDHKIPVTFILVAILYLGREVYDAIFLHDSVSQSAHILGGVIGSLLGFAMNKHKMTGYHR